MEPVTLLIAATGLVLFFLIKPIHALSLFIGVICLYPQFLTVPIGSVDFTTGRFLILPLLLRVVLNYEKLKSFRWCFLDSLVLIFAVAKIVAIAHNVSPSSFIEREGGEFFETALPYFVARMVITSKEEFLVFIKTLVLIAIPLSVLGFYQALTGHNPVQFMVKHYAWGLDQFMAGTAPLRRGLYRASVTFGIHISFGLFFAGTASLLLGLLNQRIMESRLIFISFAFMMMGMISTVSSGPIFSLVTSMGIILFFPARRYFPLLVMFVISSILFVEFYSNRHWYEVLTRFAFSPDNAYYRIGLIQEAFGGGMNGHWINGFGYVGVGAGNNNTYFNWVHKDLVNIFMAMLVRYGLVGVTPYLVITFQTYKNIYRSFTSAFDKNDSWLVWCTGATLIGWNTAMMTVSAMGQINTLLFMLFGICSNLPGIIRKRNPVYVYTTENPQMPDQIVAEVG